MSASEIAMPQGGVPRALREAAEVAGIDPSAELFNEAMRYAEEGHLRIARERLQMLLCMVPDDAEARMMLARVHAQGKRWSDALAALDEAVSHGQHVPRSLRRAIEDRLQAERSQSQEHRVAVQARSTGELQLLREEARRLRSEKTELGVRVASLEREVRKWAWATMGVSVMAIGLFVGWFALTGAGLGTDLRIATAAIPLEQTAMDVDVARAAPRRTPDAAPAGSLAATVAPALGADGATVAASVGPVPVLMAAAPSGTAEQLEAVEALRGRAQQPEGSAVEAAPAGPMDAIDVALHAIETEPGLADVAVRLSKRADAIVVTGEMSNYLQRKRLEQILVDAGVTFVDFTDVVVLSRVNGAIHRVEAGETLSHVAHRYYGNAMLTQPIQQANDLEEGLTIQAGQRLTVPPLSAR
ncbi:MAG: LysM peptidoglycan-binding domain-containing protein [Myxococcales bacterium]|nr:LysM peptidoglycan-binding domain-containing protein [Myxococcales bacterium]